MRDFRSLDSADLLFIATREERTEVFFFGTLFGFLVKFFLFGFFNGDTDNLYGRRVAVVWVARRNGHEHIQPFHDLAKNAVAIVQMRSGNMCYEELRAIRARP